LPNTEPKNTSRRAGKINVKKKAGGSRIRSFKWTHTIWR
jgi:hypothetical protein